MKFKSIYVIFCFLFLLSCNRNDSHYTKNLIVSKTIFLPAEKYVLESTSCLDYNNNILYYLTNNFSTRNNEILVYDLKKEKLIKKVVFDINNGFKNSIHGFSLVNKDSMIVSNILSDTLYSITLDGKILKKYHYNYLDKKSGQTIFKLFSRNEKPIIGHNSKLFFSPSLFVNKQKDLEKMSLAFFYNCKSRRVENLNFKYPKNYLNSKYFSTNLSYCANGSKIVFSPSNSHSIWVYNIENKTYKEFKVESDYYRHFCVNSEKDIKMNDAMYNTVSNSSYTDIVYDKYRKLYYRFFYPGLEIKKDDDSLAIKTNHFEKMSILIIDENFNKIGETFFENKFRFYSSFVSEEGLYICSNLPNEKNKNKNKKTLKYTLLKIKNE